MFNTSDTIRKLMIDKKINVTTLADKIGVKQQALSRKLQNQQEEYKIEYLEKVCQALDCSIQIQIIDNNSNDVLYTISDTDIE